MLITEQKKKKKEEVEFEHFVDHYFRAYIEKETYGEKPDAEEVVGSG